MLSYLLHICYLGKLVNMSLLIDISSLSNGRVIFLKCIQLVQSQREFLITQVFPFALYLVCKYCNEFSLTKLFQKSSVYTHCSLTRAEYPWGKIWISEMWFLLHLEPKHSRNTYQIMGERYDLKFNYVKYLNFNSSWVIHSSRIYHMNKMMPTRNHVTIRIRYLRNILL